MLYANSAVDTYSLINRGIKESFRIFLHRNTLSGTGQKARMASRAFLNRKNGYIIFSVRYHKKNRNSSTLTIIPRAPCTGSPEESVSGGSTASACSWRSCASSTDTRSFQVPRRTDFRFLVLAYHKCCSVQIDESAAIVSSLRLLSAANQFRMMN